MKKRKAIISAVCIFLVVVMVLSLTFMILPTKASAKSSAEIQEELDDLNSQRSEIQGHMQDLQDEIDSLDYQKGNTLDKKLILDQKNQLAQEELDVIDEQIAIIDGLIANTQEDLEKAREEEAYQRERWLTRVRAMEETSDVSYMEVLFEANDFSDLLTRLDLVNEVMTYDENLQQEYIEARENREALEAQAETMFAENEVRRQEQEHLRTQLETDIAAACQLIAQMENNIDEYNETLEQEAETEAEVQALIVQKEKELQEARVAEEAERLRRLAEQQAAAQAAAQAAGGNAAGNAAGGGGTTAPAGSSGTWMMWPSYTRYITSRYGMRVNPVTGKYTLHAGCDIGASYGSAIYAAASGSVIQAGSNGGYGNCVMINHGNGYTTLYGHMSSIAVSYGTTVAQGQVIGYVGSTGNSTGPHLHFEVRASASGASMDPLGFSYY